MDKTIYIDLETQVFLYLDRLRESGIVNMYGARPYVEDEFGLGRQEAKELLIEWMETFEDRHPLDK
jgi:hypothetical protein